MAGAIEPEPAFAQGYAVGGSRPSLDRKLKLHAEATLTSGQRNAALPKIGIALPVHERLEIGADLHVRHLRRSDHPPTSGLGDIELKAKHLLLDARNNPLRIDASLEFKLSLPTGSANRNLGEGQMAMKLPLTFSRKVGSWEFGGLLGAQFVHRRDKAMLLAGMLVTREIGDGFKIGSELVTEMRWRGRREQELMADVGLRYAPSRTIELFAIGGHALQSRNGQPLQKVKVGLEINLGR